MLIHRPIMRRARRVLDIGGGLSPSGSCGGGNFSSSEKWSREFRVGVGVPDDKGMSLPPNSSTFASVVDDITAECWLIWWNEENHRSKGIFIKFPLNWFQIYPAEKSISNSLFSVRYRGERFKFLRTSTQGCVTLKLKIAPIPNSVRNRKFRPS